jgi:hypothetical protein
MSPKGPSKGDAKNWDGRYKELEAYHKEHGHSNVPSTLRNSLSTWVGHQRQNRQNEEVRMTAERIARLDNWTLDGLLNDKKRQPIKVKEKKTKAGVRCTRN